VSTADQQFLARTRFPELQKVSIFIPLSRKFVSDVFVSLQHPTTDAPIWSSRLVADHFKHTVATTGQYRLCFRQTSSQARQTASFQIHTQSDYDSYFGGDSGATLASKSQTEKLTIVSSQIESKVNELLDQQDYAITRESIHRQTAEETYESILSWSIAQILVILTVSAIQLYYLKRTFDIKLIV
jgi:hypothetical protein